MGKGPVAREFDRVARREAGDLGRKAQGIDQVGRAAAQAA
jgi:hypothetical protein